MASANDLEKEAGHEDTNQLPELQQVNTESTFEEALNAQANIEPPIPGGAPNVTREKSLDPGPPPNGGFAAWLQVAGSFFLFFNSWYVARCVLQD